MYSCTPLRPLAPYAAIRNIPQNSDVTGIATWDDVLVPWLGTPYLSGGTTKNGTDCSGFVSSVYLEKERMYIPRTTTEEYKMGKDVTRDNLVIGDLVFFGNGRRVSHVGIYVGRGNFIHASSSKGVTVSPLEDNYWKPKYMGARRYL
ncbi:MAG: C40 family peptidase [Fibromonadaceae bacterium]|nr:C40 family peptidase [Fibromonadaceae bacterium]